MQTTILDMLEKEPKSLTRKIIITIIVVGLILWSANAITFRGHDGDTMAIIRSIIRGLLHPNVGLLVKDVPRLLLETIGIAFVGTLVGSILAIPFAFLSATNIVPKPIAYITNLVIMAIRTIPAFILGLMFIRVTGPGAFAGLLTMSVASIGMMSKLYTEAIEELDPGIIESLDAAGANTFEKIRYGVVEQLLADFMSTTLYRFDMNLRDVPVLGLVGAGGIGAPLIFAMQTHRWADAGAILIGLILLILIIEFFSTKIRNKLVKG